MDEDAGGDFNITNLCCEGVELAEELDAEGREDAASLIHTLISTILVTRALIQESMSGRSYIIKHSPESTDDPNGLRDMDTKGEG